MRVPQRGIGSPSEGQALDKRPRQSRTKVPTARRFALPQKRTVGPLGRIGSSTSHRVVQGFALRWMNGWAFDPNVFRHGTLACQRLKEVAG